jgi:ATP-binding cassette subfamily F protein 3
MATCACARCNATWPAEAAHDGAALARLHAELDSADGYTADARARKLLAGLGSPTSRWTAGRRFLRWLADAPEPGPGLMCPSDLLLLDEPTNHLDLDAILWLEDWLKSYPARCC